MVTDDDSGWLGGWVKDLDDHALSVRLSRDVYEELSKRAAEYGTSIDKMADSVIRDGMS